MAFDKRQHRYSQTYLLISDPSKLYVSPVADTAFLK
jgi:hypothetical protein